MEIIALKIAVVAFMWIVILSEEKCCNWWFRFGARFDKYWFHAPIWGCELCFSGQVALWYYVVKCVKISGFRLYSNCYSLPEHIYFICFTIFCTLIISKTYIKLFKK